MEQEAVFDVGEFDERDVSLIETPRDPLHYLQQVAILTVFKYEMIFNLFRLLAVKKFHLNIVKEDTKK